MQHVPRMMPCPSGQRGSDPCFREFAPRQKQLLASCDAHVARINAKKRTLLLKHVLQTVGYQDTAIADELAAGFPLFGWLPESMELPRHPQPPALRAHGPSVASLQMIQQLTRHFLTLHLRNCSRAG